jgi:hypothetical protein
MEPLSILGPLLKKGIDWILVLLRKRKENQMEAVNRQVLTWFEEARTRGVYGRFCPSRTYILEAFKTDDSAETVSRTLAKLVGDGYVEYDDGRYYLKCKPNESPY